MSRSSPEPPLAAIVLDVDGTLLTSDHRITAPTRAAITRARAAGVRVLLASARGPAGLRPILSELEVDGPLIAFSGALVSELVERRISQASAWRVLASARELGLEVGWYAGERCCAPAIGSGLRREAAITRERFEPLSADDRPPAPHKLLCIGAPPALRVLEGRLPDDCHGQHSHHNYLEILARGVDKADALARVCEALGVPRTAVAAVGDGANDIGLLQFAGVGVAMGHAEPAVRAAADWTTGSNDEDGVARVIDQLLGPVPCC